MVTFVIPFVQIRLYLAPQRVSVAQRPLSRLFQLSALLFCVGCYSLSHLVLLLVHKFGEACLEHVKKGHFLLVPVCRGLPLLGDRGSLRIDHDVEGGRELLLAVLRAPRRGGAAGGVGARAVRGRKAPGSAEKCGIDVHKGCVCGGNGVNIAFAVDTCADLPVFDFSCEYKFGMLL